MLRKIIEFLFGKPIKKARHSASDLDVCIENPHDNNCDCCCEDCDLDCVIKW